ncbi:hypothetical protein [Actinokineospora spheciospongiae]|uniref:hypothetical protein n=1 Tax=Actinokineospora spheciospongiae TaxID=909613 RepID=UPI0005562E8D|nr:hypothetical protein [Actinokineospora spheciospongiae]
MGDLTVFPHLSETQAGKLESELAVRLAESDEVNRSPALVWLRNDRLNGGAQLQGIVLGSPDLVDEIARHHLPSLFPDILAHRAVRHLLPDSLDATRPLNTGANHPPRGWRPVPAIGLAAEWARAMYDGSFGTDPRESTAADRDHRALAALAQANDLYRTLFGERYSSVSCLSSPDPWAPWFRGLFNTTWAAYAGHSRTLWMLTLTDMD